MNYNFQYHTIRDECPGRGFDLGLIYKPKMLISSCPCLYTPPMTSDNDNRIVGEVRSVMQHSLRLIGRAKGVLADNLRVISCIDKLLL